MNYERNMVEKGRCAVILGGGFGSEGKGLAAAWVGCTSIAPDYAVTNAGAQAGHTSLIRGNRFVTYHLPTIGVINRVRTISYLCAGSIIDPAAFWSEIADLGMPTSSIRIHPRAAIIEEAHRVSERLPGASTTRLGSTQKGVGAALAAKVMRHNPLVGGSGMAGPHIRIERIDLNAEMREGKSVTLEIPQGTSLSVNHGNSYPECTSRDCTLMAGLSDAGIHPSYLGSVMMVMRTYPIRVGHIYDANGNKIGDSGPFYDDSQELDWAEHFPGIEPERTTVTKRVRRIATWSERQYEASLSLNRPTVVMLNFVNYCKNSMELEKIINSMNAVHRKVGCHPDIICGVGPDVNDVVPLHGAFDWLNRRGHM